MYDISCQNSEKLSRFRLYAGVVHSFSVFDQNLSRFCTNYKPSFAPSIECLLEPYLLHSENF